MRNKLVGYIIIGISLIIGIIILLFNRAMTRIVSATCTHGSECTMWESIKFQTNISIMLMVFVILIGAYLIFFTNDKSSNQSKTRPTNELMKSLNSDEKIIIQKITDSEGTIFQSELTEKTSFSKVKVTRILDRLEGKKLIERKRRGMTNIVILKQ